MLEGNYSARHGSVDLIKYTISYHGKTVTAEDTAIPPSLQSVIDELNRVLTMSAVVEPTAKSWGKFAALKVRKFFLLPL